MIKNTQAASDLRGGQDVFDAGGIVVISTDVNMQKNIWKHKRAFIEKVAIKVSGKDEPLNFFDGLDFELRLTENKGEMLLCYNNQKVGKIFTSDIELNSVRFMFVPMKFSYEKGIK